MLTQLVALLENAPHGLSLAEISRALDAQPAAVAGMLDFLVQSGRLTAVGAADSVCGTCGLAQQCSLLAARGKCLVSAVSSAYKTTTGPRIRKI